MHISNLKLWNFRRYGASAAIDLNMPNLNLDFHNGLNVIIGENDSGKTAIIDALKLVLKTHSYEYIRVDDLDFFKGTERFRIEIEFIDLEPEEAKNFTEWLGWKGNGAAAKPYLRLIYDVSRKGNRIIPTDIKAGVGNDGYTLTAEAREYLKATYLKPLRDAENELIAKKNSRLSQILMGDIAFKDKGNDHELVKIFNDLNAEIIKYFKGETIEVKDENGVRQPIAPQQGKAIKDKIDAYIKSFYSVANESDFNAVSADVKAILEKITLSLKDELNPGLGTLNRLFMAAELLHLSKESWTGIRLGLVEELEAHLHPQAQMQVIEALQKEKKIQMILTTHSPNLASKLELNNLILCHKGKAFPLGPNYTKLNAGDYKFLEKFLDTTKANLFFAKGLILVEGWAEEILIPSIAKNIGIDLTEKGVSIVNIGNIAFQRYSKIFLRNTVPVMEIPVAVLTDNDVSEFTKGHDAAGDLTVTKKVGATYAAEADAKVAALERNSESNVKYFVAPEWTLEYSIFKSVGLGGTFNSISQEIHSGTDWTNFEDTLAKMLFKKTLNKTEIAYRMAHAIDEDLKEVEIGVKATKAIVVDPNVNTETLNYIVKAIKYAAGY
ncbi:MAG: AAA family ATPase [Lentimicrobiaceae bacterium]|jgi:putative ATP-dependent endonuclease of OLD family